MTTIRRVIAASVAAGALALGVGLIQASAATVAEPDTAKTVVVAGGGQGGWPMSR